MRRPGFVSVATWMIERGTPRRMDEALAGDLLEELHAGRSAGWYWRQVLVALGQSAANSVRPYAVALGYSVVWSVLFAWCFGGAWDRYWAAELQRWSAFEFPWSSLLLVTGGLVPSMSCVCLGFLVYVLLAGVRTRVSGTRLLGSFSLGLNVLFVTRICVSCWHVAAVAGPHLTVQETSFLAAQQTVWGVPLVLSLWAAIVCALGWPGVAAGRASSSV